jgi:hypothetical protein
MFLLVFLWMNNDSMPPKYTTFYHIIYVVRWSPTTFWVFSFFKNKLRWGTILPHRQGGEKVVYLGGSESLLFMNIEMGHFIAFLIDSPIFASQNK